MKIEKSTYETWQKRKFFDHIKEYCSETKTKDCFLKM